MNKIQNPETPFLYYTPDMLSQLLAKILVYTPFIDYVSQDKIWENKRTNFFEQKVHKIDWLERNKAEKHERKKLKVMEMRLKIELSQLYHHYIKSTKNLMINLMIKGKSDCCSEEHECTIFDHDDSKKIYFLIFKIFKFILII